MKSIRIFKDLQQQGGCEVIQRFTSFQYPLSNTLTNVIKSGIELEDFIRYYDSHDTNVLLKAMQEIVEKHFIME